MHDVELMRMMTNDRIETLRHAAARPVRPAPPRRLEERADIELRLCKAADDDALARLGALAERPVPNGRLVVAFVDGALVAALPLAGGTPLTDPFARTAHLIGLLELRAKQLRQPAFGGGSFRLLRRHA